MEVGPVALEGEGLSIAILGEWRLLPFKEKGCPLPCKEKSYHMPFKGKGCSCHSRGWWACPLQFEIRIIDSMYLIEYVVYTTHEYYEIHTTFILRRGDCQLPFKAEWALLGPGSGGAAHCHFKGRGARCPLQDMGCPLPLKEKGRQLPCKEKGCQLPFECNGCACH